MKHLLPLAVLATALVQTACSTNATKKEAITPTLLSEEEAAIPFFNTTVRHSAAWQTNGDEGIWIQDGRRDWYYAKLNGPCFGVDYALRLGFDTGSSDRLDRFSRIIVPQDDGGQPGGCMISSLKRSAPPPDGRKRTDVEETKSEEAK